ncbi:sugar phosphate isomerase/epimerase [candidate division KSB1 bacterium]|nr:sugar phosphate isomerase/epimerase [candidate division KSB1 bacterium]RQW01810.1 MAG: sugar phosphate isomerase/epimerase [candidate division KSB1 bacterium]
MRTHPLGAFIICDDGLDLRLHTATRLSISTAQILAPPATHRTAEYTKMLKEKFEHADIRITVVFCGFAGESYADIPTVKRTIGLVPEATRSERLDEARHISDFAKKMDVDAIGLHIGFIPEDKDDPVYADVIAVARELCDHAARNNQRVHLETGQETAPTLLRFFKDVNRANLAINFDPANMILYGSGEPIAALQLVGQYVKSVHCKDAVWAKNPGLEWGEEVPLGAGDVNMELFLQTLKEIGYVGPLTIEREISGEEQAKDIEKGVRLLNSLVEKIWGEKND